MLLSFLVIPMIISPILARPRQMPTGIPTAPMQSPSKSTELRNCFDVAPTEERIPICRMRSFREMLNELYIRNMEPTMIIAVTITPAGIQQCIKYPVGWVVR